MAGPRRIDRLSGQDRMALRFDELGWPEDIGALAILDGRRLLDHHGRVRLQEIRRHLDPKLALVPRFRQSLYRPPWGLGRPLWVDAATFDLADHLRVHPLPAPADEAQLLAACETLGRRPLNPARPLWEAWLLPGLPEGQVGLFLRAHHALADGVAGVAAFGALLDLDADAAPSTPAPWTPAPIPSARELFRDNLQRRLQGVSHRRSSLTHPNGAGPRTEPGSLSIWRELLAGRAPRTSLNRPIGAGRRLAIVRSRLELARQIAHAHHATVNDVVLAAVAGGLAELLASRGEPVQDLTLRTMVPISLHRERPRQASGNKDGMMVVPLPLGEPDPVRRLELIAAQTAERKRHAHPQPGRGLMSLTVVQRASIRLLARQRFVNLPVSNVPGPPMPLYLAGARLLELFPLFPIVGNQTLGVVVLSYAGQLNLTAVADRDACPDLEVFTQGVRGALDGLARSAPAPGDTVSAVAGGSTRPLIGQPSPS